MHGYSSSSGSDDDYRPRQKIPAPAGTSSSSNADAKNKKRKPKMPPQLSINRVWKRFSKKRFNKALSVLPFDPVPPPAVSDRANELLAAGYERAAEECRRKVRKIIGECRRVNMRYRDPGFDLDWDLKMERGHCLNSLGKTSWDLSQSNMQKPSATVPKAVKRIHEIFNKPTFMKDISGGDVKQGSLGDCWLMASFSGLANVTDGIQRLCVEYDTRIGIYGFVFYRDGEWIYSIIDDKLYLKSPCWDSPSMQRDLLQQIDREDVERVYRETYQTGSKALFFGKNKEQNETWVPLIQKAYAKAHGDFACLTGGWIGEGLEDLSGGVTTELLASDILDLDGFWDEELSRVNEEFMFGCSTGILDGGYGEREGISEGHAYVIMEAKKLKDGSRLLKLRNPWGKTRKGIWEGAWSDGSKEWTTDVKEELGHSFGGDSVFWISYEDLLRKYQHFDRTRLFRDPDWRCTQHWIGVEVPWKAQFNEKFQFTLTRESPLVLVLSQLDNRYYRGLQGQYTFRLHFRLHEQDKPGAEDYIVRSHGNYLMMRSVSVELPAMLPGTYSVFISVTAERDTRVSSVEDVVKRECKRRVQNEKLAQVGAAYDLAHSKAHAHLEEVYGMRQRADQQKASRSRVEERQRNWEKRHKTREVTKLQGRKNNQKLEEKKKAREEKERKAAEEEKAKKEIQDKAVQTGESSDKKKSKRTKKRSSVIDEKKSDDKPEIKIDQTAVADDLAETPEATPLPTPAATPAVEKTEDQAAESVDGQVEDRSDEVISVTSSESSGQATPKSDGSQTPAASDKDKEKVDDVPEDAESKSVATDNKETKEAGDDAKPKSGSCSCGCTGGCKEEKKKEEPPAPKKKSANMYVTSEGESSASPISDWEELYSSDDMTRKPRLGSAPAAGTALVSKYRGDSDDEEADLPDPWNAICCVGLRVYSKDEDLSLRVVVEGGELAEGGMGEKGEADLDNAQANAGGERCPVGGLVTDAETGDDEDESVAGGYEGDSEEEKRRRRRRRSEKKGRKKMSSSRRSVASASESSEDSDSD